MAKYQVEITSKEVDVTFKKFAAKSAGEAVVNALSTAAMLVSTDQVTDIRVREADRDPYDF